MKAVEAAFNQEKALVGAFSVIMKTDCETDVALHSTSGRVEQETELEQVRRRILPSFTFTQDEECEPSTHSPEQREE